MRTETHLYSEFVSKMAGSHSVKNLRTIYEECGRIRSTSCTATANGCSSTANAEAKLMIGSGPGQRELRSQDG